MRPTAHWWPAEPLTHRSVLRVYQAISAQRGYPTAPMSMLLLDGRLPDLTFQKTFNTVAKRHHIRIWQQPGQVGGRDVWIAAATMISPCGSANPAIPSHTGWTRSLTAKELRSSMISPLTVVSISSS